MTAKRKWDFPTLHSFAKPTLTVCVGCYAVVRRVGKDLVTFCLNCDEYDVETVEMTQKELEAHHFPEGME